VRRDGGRKRKRKRKKKEMWSCGVVRYRSLDILSLVFEKGSKERMMIDVLEKVNRR
jgi:hypothetical protein